MLPSNLPPALPRRTALLAALLGTIPTAGATQQFPDVKGPNNSLTSKGGIAAAGNAHLSLEERRALDAAASAGAQSIRSAELQDAMNKGEGPFQARQGELSVPLINQDLLHLDTDADGTLWAYGGSYKASFDADGATYIPFLGSDAPRNFPVAFSAPHITINGTALDSEAKSDPEFADTTVVFERAGVRELYDIRKEGLEQLFVFDELDQRGEIVVRTQISSELVAHEGANGLEFVGEYGSVGYSTAIAIDGRGRRSPVATTFVDGAVELRVPAAFVERAALPLTIDPIISTFPVSLDSTRKDSNSDIAYDSSEAEWMIIWQRAFSATDNDVMAGAFDPTGIPVPGSLTFIDITSASWSTPRIANNAKENQFLIVASVAGAPARIWGRTREAGSASMGAQFPISFVVGDCVTPDVGGDSGLVGATHYMVVWERQLNLAVDHDVLGQLVTTSGTLQGSLISIDNSSGSYDKVPTVSKSAGTAPIASQRWNIVWQRQFTPTDWDIRTAQYRPNGAVASPTSYLNAEDIDDRWPQPSSLLDEVDPRLPRQWLGVWQRTRANGTRDLHAAVVKGPAAQFQVNLSSLIGTGENEEQLQPSADSTGKQFVVAWTESFFSSVTDADTRAVGLYIAGEELLVSEGPVVLATGARYQGSVQACSRRSGGIQSDYVGVSWQDHQANGNHNIGAAVYEALDHYSNSIGTAYCGPAIINSSGRSAKLIGSGSAIAGPEPLVLTAWNMPLDVFGYIIGSPNTTNVLPGGTSGRVCVGNPLSRFNAGGLIRNTESSGSFDVPINTEAIPTPAGGIVTLTAGQTFHFQAWFRDGITSNLTEGLRVLMR